MAPYKRILIAGKSGMVGSALIRAFQNQNNDQITLLTPSKQELNCLDQLAVRHYLQKMKPDGVIVAAAKVGGIEANQTQIASFLYENLMIAANLIHESHNAAIERLLFLGSSCIYPKFAEQPIKEEALLTGMLEPTNEGYALAKIAGVKLCQFYSSQYGRKYISAMPTNLYGPNDNYHPTHSHVIPGLIRRIYEAKCKKDPVVKIWGTGEAKREFLYVDDLARACLFLFENYYEKTHINVGSDEEVTIAELSQLIAKTVGFEGDFIFDTTKPDGTPRKKTDISKITSLGWRAQISLNEGLNLAFADFVTNVVNRRE